MEKTQAKKQAKPKKGSKYECSTCGMVVLVDKECACEDSCDILCCEKPMVPKK